MGGAQMCAERPGNRSCDRSVLSNSHEPSFRIAFIGNSFTFYNDLPHLVESFLTEGYTGHSVIVGACLRGGASFRTLWEKGANMEQIRHIGDRDMFPTVEALLQEPLGWDVVVLQDYSQAPARENRRADSLAILQRNYVPLLLALKTPPLVLLYQTWGYRSAAQNSEAIGDFSQMTIELVKGYGLYSEMLSQTGIQTVIAPVGEAFAAIHSKAREFWPRLYQADHRHPRAVGSFLSGSRIAVTIATHARFSDSFPRGLQIQPFWPPGVETFRSQAKPSPEELAFVLNVAGLDAPAGVIAMAPIPLPKHLLVIGSSVSTGSGADKPQQNGWSALMRKSISRNGFNYTNHGLDGTHVNYWNSALDRVSADAFRQFGIVVMSLSLGNEGLPGCSSKEEITRVEKHYVSGLRSIVQKLRSKMLRGARLVLGGPYANDNYRDDHFMALQRVLTEIRSWEDVDYVIDFLQPRCHDGQGRWPDDCSVDPGHPNDSGHQRMFECVDLEEVLGNTSKR